MKVIEDWTFTEPRGALEAKVTVSQLGKRVIDLLLEHTGQSAKSVYMTPDIARQVGWCLISLADKMEEKPDSKEVFDDLVVKAFGEALGAVSAQREQDRRFARALNEVTGSTDRVYGKSEDSNE